MATKKKQTDAAQQPSVSTIGTYRPLDTSGNDYAGMVGMSDLDRAALDAAGKSYNDALAAGDKAGMDAAHRQAEKVREKYNYSGGVDGSQYLPEKEEEVPYWAKQTWTPRSTGPSEKFTYESAPEWTSKYQSQIEDLLKDIQNREAFSYKDAPTWESRYQGQIDDLASDILNREEFSYDPETDPRYAAYKKEYAREGQRATADALGQYAAMTGGMPSTAAMTAASQAGDYYSARMADKIPELYQAAYDMYMDQGNTMRQNLSMLQGMDATEYNQFLNNLTQYNTDRNFAYGQYMDEGNAMRQNLSALQGMDESDYNKYLNSLNQYNTDRNFAYGAWSDQRNFDYQQERDAIEDALQQQQMAQQQYQWQQQFNADNSHWQQEYETGKDQWQQQFDTGNQQWQQQFDANNSQWQQQFDANNSQWQQQFDANNSQWQQQFDASQEQQDYARRSEAAQLLAGAGDFSGYSDLFGLTDAQTQALVDSYARTRGLDEQQAAWELAQHYADYGDFSKLKELGVNTSWAEKERDLGLQSRALSSSRSSSSGGSSRRSSGSGSKSSGSGSSTPSGDVYAWLTSNGATDYGTAYAMLRDAGYGTTDANRYAQYFEENAGSFMQDRIANDHGDDWVYVVGVGKMSYSKLEKAVNSGEIVEMYDEKTGKYSYKLKSLVQRGGRANSGGSSNSGGRTSK